MRIRGTKPEFWKSKRIASVSWDARLVLKGLESYVDDNGVGVDDIELIVTDVFPRDMFANPRGTVARVTEAISELFRAGLVHRYDANGEHLLFVSFWESVQRIDKPTSGRFPRPDGSMCYKDSYIREPLARTPETLAPVTGEQGNRGTGEQGKEKTCPVGPDEFMDWYLEYPRKEARAGAEKAYIKARTLASAEQLLDGARRYAADPNREGKYTKLPATWLNGGCWDDDPLPPRNQPGTRPTGSQVRLQAGYELMQRAQAKQTRQQQHLEIENP